MHSSSELARFLRAVRIGDLDAVRSAAEANPALVRATDPDCFGSTPLIRAVEADNRAVVDLLLELGADINQRSDWWAGSFGVLDSASDKMAAYLLGRGATLTVHAAARLGMIDRLEAMLAADPALVHARGGDGQTPLHFARTAQIADLLLRHGAEIDALDIDHASTPAQWLSGSRPEVSAHLVSRGAAPDPFLACRIGDIPLLQDLVQAEPEGIRVRLTRDRFPAAPPAAGHIYMYTIGEGSTLAHAASGAGQSGSVRWLGEHGADLNARAGYDDGTPLHVAAWGDHPGPIEALIDAGADINAVSGRLHRNEPIGWAIVSGAVGAFCMLRGRGAVLRKAHLDDAVDGAEGAFREYNPKRPIEAWREILRLLTTV